MALNGRALLQHLPQDTRGPLLANVPLAQQTWFGVGGVAEVLFKPVDENDLASFLARCPADIPVTVIGVASNLLIRDGGIPGAVIRLGPSFGLIKRVGDDFLAGAAAIDLNTARAAQDADIADLEFLSGIPGSVGGGLRMNAGAYGREFKDIVIEATAILRNGEKRVMSNAELGFAYRHSGAPEDCVFVSALLRGKKSDAAQIRERMAMIQKSRSASQPIREKTGGSTFANPENDPKQRKAWQLIEAAGCRHLKLGNAQVSGKHCNFLINTGNATANDIETLGELVRQRVLDKFGIDLRWEIKRIGLKKEEV